MTSERGGQVLTRNSRREFCGGLRGITKIFFPGISVFPRHNFSTISYIRCHINATLRCKALKLSNKGKLFRKSSIVICPIQGSKCCDVHLFITYTTYFDRQLQASSGDITI